MDRKDTRLMQLLQEDSSTALQDLAADIGLSTSPCWRRIQSLYASGLIKKQVALCDPLKLNLGLTAFVTVRAREHNDEWTQRFVSGVMAIPEVVELHRMTGEVDYLLKVVAPDMERFNGIYQRLINVAPLQDVSSSFSMSVMKYTTALPVDYARSGNQ